MGTYVFDALLTREEDGYSAEVPSLPGCFTCGDDFEDAVAMALDAAKTWVASALRHGEKIPENRRVDTRGPERVRLAFDVDSSWISDAAAAGGGA